MATDQAGRFENMCSQAKLSSTTDAMDFGPRPNLCVVLRKSNGGGAKSSIGHGGIAIVCCLLADFA